MCPPGTKLNFTMCGTMAVHPIGVVTAELLSTEAKLRRLLDMSLQPVSRTDNCS